MFTQNIIHMTELHRKLGKVIHKVALSNEHFVVEKGGLPVAVMLSMPEYERLVKERNLRDFEYFARLLGQIAERTGLTEEIILSELEETKREIYSEVYGKD